MNKLMKNKFTIKMILVLIVSVSISFTKTKNDEYFKWKDAEILYQKKDYENALKIYLEIFNQNSTSYEYLKKIKLILNQKKEYSLLIDCYMKFIKSTLNEKLLFEAETDLIEIKIWNKDISWVDDLYKLEKKYENKKNNIYKYEFILLRIAKNKQTSNAYEFIRFIRKKYNKPIFFSRKLISIFKDDSKYEESINESIIYITESKKINKISSITKNLILDQMFESLNIILNQSKLNNNYLPISNKQFHSNLFFNLNQKIEYDYSRIEYIINIYNRLINLDIRIEDSLFELSDIYLNIYSDLDSAFSILNKLETKSKKNYYDKLKAKQSNILISKGYLDSALTLISSNDSKFENYKSNKNVDIKKLEILLYKGDYNKFIQHLNLLIDNVQADKNSMNDLLELKMISLYFENDREKFEKYSNVLFKIKMNKSFESIIELVNLINDENILISELAHFQYSIIELQKGNIENTLTLIEEMKNKTVYSEISMVMYAEIEDRINNNYKEAIKFYEKILEKFPDTIHKENILKRLNELNDLIIEEYEL